MSNQAFTSDQYVPGVCNINQQEITKRKIAGYAGSIVFIVILTVLLLTSLSRWYRLVLFLPAFIAAIGFIQAKNKFCVGYGGAGMQNAAAGSTKAQQVTDQNANRADKQRARQLKLLAFGFAIALTLVTLIIPVLS